jgi:cyclase
MKRIIFALLHCDGHYMLSRNFGLQRVGDIGWVLRNYEIRRVSLGIDELMILDVSPQGSDRSVFHRDVERLVTECFVPVTVGGRLRSLTDVATCFAVGADKVLMNRAFFDAPALCEGVAATYGSQALVAGIDVVDAAEGRQTPPAGPKFVARSELRTHVRRVVEHGAGEVLVQSVDRDGTGNGLDLGLARTADTGSTPLILMGGVGHASHLSEGLRDDAVDAVATANLFNFIGDTLFSARARVRADDVPLATWANSGTNHLRDTLRQNLGFFGSGDGVGISGRSGCDQT